MTADRIDGHRKLGVRERSKRETQAKIIRAARELFQEGGYDGATMRQIAARAGLGLGTLSNYVAVKRDLIYLIFNEEMDALTGDAIASPLPAHTFVQKMLAVAEVNFRLFASEPVLSRILLSEILQHTPGLHLERYLLIRDRLIRGMETVVAEAQKTGEIRSKETPALIALNVFFIISASARWFLAAPQPSLQDGLQLCERMLNLMMHGLCQPTPGKPKSGAATRKAKA